MILITVLHFLISWSHKKIRGGVRRESVGATFGYYVLNETKTINTSAIETKFSKFVRF